MKQWHRVVLGVFAFLWLIPIFTVRAQSGEPTIELISPRVTLAVGETTVWEVSIQPLKDYPLSGVSLEIVDPLSWQVLSASSIPEPCSSLAVISLQVVAIKPGDLLPLLRLSYTLHGESRQAIIRAGQPVTVKPVTALVQFLLSAPQIIPQNQSKVILILTIENNSPFTLQPAVENYSSGLTFVEDPVIKPITPGLQVAVPLSLNVISSSPVPRLSVTYTWNDPDPGRLASAQTLVTSGDIQRRSDVWEENLATLLGVVFGAVIGFATNQAGQFIERMRQAKMIRGRAFSLLKLSARQAQYAAQRGALVDMTTLKAVFEAEQLFEIFKKDEIFKSCLKLWECAEKYNQDLQKLHGAERMLDLVKAAQELETHVLSAEKRLKSPKTA